MTERDECPACHADLTGQEIPSEQRHLFGATHFSRRIGLSDIRLDRVTHWLCPDCGHEWERNVTSDTAVT